MKDCIFCAIVSKPDKECNSEPVNSALYEDDLVIVKPALGMSIANYLTVFTKKHHNGFAEFGREELIGLERLIDRICDAYHQHMGIYPVIFEHGSLKNGRHPLSITHAHMHIIPIKLTSTSISKLFKDLKLTKKDSIAELKALEHKDYWVYRSNDRAYYMSHTILDAPRSIFIKLVATQVGYDNTFEWRDEKNNQEDLVRTTIDTFQKMKL